MSVANTGPAIMGIVNVTPDSFSDGGRFAAHDAAVEHALRLISHGADWIDVGGESTRPGAEPVSAQEEADRVIPVIAALRAQSDVLISVDTMKSAVAREAVKAGADMWNDVTALTGDRNSAQTAAELGCQVCLMHMLGNPRDMQKAPAYTNVVDDVIAYLRIRLEKAVAAGVDESRVWIDPGIGFGKRLEHNLALIRATDRIIHETGRPMLFGASRKRFITMIDESAETARDRLGGSLAAALEAARLGADIIRVHDVRETVQAIKVHQAILS